MTLVKREVREINDPWDGVIATAVSVFDKGDSMSIVRSSKRTGVNNSSGARYYRWTNTSAYKVRHNGNRIYGVTMERNRTRAKFYTDSSLAQASAKITRTWSPLFEEKFGEFTVENMFPVAAMLGIDTFGEIPGPMAGWMQTDNFRTFVENMFGKTRYRKDLTKAMAERDKLIPAWVAREFRGLVPIDWIIQFIKNSDYNVNNFDKLYSVRKHLLAIDPRSYRSLLRDVDCNFLYINDIGRSPHFPTGRFNTWRDFHDTCFPNHYRRDRQLTWSPPTPPENKEIKPTQIAKSISAAPSSSVTLVTAQDTDTLRDWGQYMGNCIGGYASEAVSGSLTLGAAVAQDKVIANFEVNHDGVLRQLLGRFNRILEEPDYSNVLSLLEGAGVETGSEFWGKRQPQLLSV